jgi:hypothetical protein
LRVDADIRPDAHHGHVPSLHRLGRLARTLTLPETRALVQAVARSEGLRALPHRALHDRAGLFRDLRHPGNPRALARGAVAHPVTRELANVGLVLVPGRYGPVGWVAKWATGRALRHFFDRQSQPTSPRPER